MGVKVQKPGRIVVVVGHLATANGTDEAPAIVTRWFGEDGPVNVTIFLDEGQAIRATSLPLFADEASAREWLGGADRNTAAYWPWTGAIPR